MDLTLWSGALALLVAGTPVLDPAFGQSATLQVSASSPDAKPAAVLLEGTSLSGVGTVESILGLAVDDAGRCLVLAEVDEPPEYDEVLLLDGQPVLIEGDAIPGAPGLQVSGLMTPLAPGCRDLRGFPFETDDPWVAELSGSATALGATGLFRGVRARALSGQGYEGAGLEPSARWRGVRSVAVRGGNAIMIARFEDALGATFTVLVQDSQTESGRRSSNAILRCGERVPGAGSARLAELSEHPLALALSRNGSWAAAATIEDGDERRGVLLRDGQLIHANGDAAPATAMRFDALESASLALDGFGGLALVTSISGADGAGAMALFDGENELARVGLPVAGGSTQLGALSSFGVGTPLLRSPEGRILWFGRFDDPEEKRDTALMLGPDPLVVEGDVTRAGRSIDVLSESSSGLALSPNGRWLLFRAVLDGGTEGAFRLDLGGVTPRLGCDSGSPILRIRGGRAATGSELLLEVVPPRGSEALYTAGTLLLSPAPEVSGDPCGQASSLGDLLVGAEREPAATGVPVDGGARLEFRLILPPPPPSRPGDLATPVYALQAVVAGPGGGVGPTTTLTTGLLVELGGGQ